VFEFRVIGGPAVREAVEGHREEIVQVVRQAYLTHHDGDSINPDSYFLRFPDMPANRIIALPAYLGGAQDVAGIKWIASFPANIDRGIPRASAVLLLNDCATGYPFAALEAAQISAARTAASAALAAAELTGGRRAHRLAVIGAGIIARNTLEFLAAEGWIFDEVVVHDQVPQYRDALVEYAAEHLGWPVAPADGLEAALDGADLDLLATTAGEPYITDPAAFAAGAVVLNISLRDISPQLILAADNILDDVEHCLKANTSPHLAEQACGNRDFVTGTLAQVIRGDVKPAAGRPVIFSPFGLGVLDLAVGMFAYRMACESGRAVDMPEFFGETRRW
jgi:2,3-diaminopropionate biosynthesis protein SbnB